MKPVLVTITARKGYTLDCQYYSEKPDTKAFWCTSVKDLLDTASNWRVGNGKVESDSDDNQHLSDALETIILAARAISYPVALGKVWKLRESNRMEQGEYARVPDIGYEFPYEHFAHLPKKDSTDDSIAYTENAEKGFQDRQTIVRLGRYLKKFNPGMPDTEIQKYVKALRSELSPHTYKLKYTTDRDVISDIFETRMCACGSGGSVSCMYGKFTDWSKRPYWVYADSPDVAVAYMTDENDNIVARSVVANSTKQWVRIYATHKGDNVRHETLCSTFKTLVEAEGYEEGDLTDCRLTYLGSNIMPYLDGCQGVKHKDGYWLVTETRYDYIANSTDGRLSEDCDDDDDANDDPICNDCDGSSDVSYSTYEGCYLCDDCSTEAVYNSRGSTDRVRRTVEACDGEAYARVYAENNLPTDDGGEIHCPNCDCDEMRSVESCNGDTVTGYDVDDLIKDNDGDYHEEGCDCEHMQLVPMCTQGECYTWAPNVWQDSTGLYHKNNCNCAIGYPDTTNKHDNQLELISCVSE